MKRALHERGQMRTKGKILSARPGINHQCQIDQAAGIDRDHQHPVFNLRAGKVWRERRQAGRRRRYLFQESDIENGSDAPLIDDADSHRLRCSARKPAGGVGHPVILKCSYMKRIRPARWLVLSTIIFLYTSLVIVPEWHPLAGFGAQARPARPGTLELAVLDDASGQPAPARVELLDAEGQGYVARDALPTDGDCVNRVIPADYERFLTFSR